MFDASRRTLVVVGAQWGDEGKGKLVDVLAERADWVVRYQGGANAGHTVHIGDKKVVLHQIPSGILNAGVRCAIGNGVVLDPEKLFGEIDALVADGIDVTGRLYVSERAHLVMPYHKMVDGNSASSKAIGTTGRGIGPTYEDKVARRGVRVLDLRNPTRLRTLVEAGVAHANGRLALMNCDARADVEETLATLAQVSPRLLALADDVGLQIHRALKSGAAVLLEEDAEEVLLRLSSMSGAVGRFELVMPGSKFTAIVDYAHTPDALKNVLETISHFRSGQEQVISVFGCGGNRDKSKRPLMAAIACKYSDKVIFTADNPRDEDPMEIIREMQKGVGPTEAKKTLVMIDREEAIKTACMMAKEKDIILVAGKGHETYQEVKGVKRPFDDREVVGRMLKMFAN